MNIIFQENSEKNVINSSYSQLIFINVFKNDLVFQKNTKENTTRKQGISKPLESSIALI
jgi:hypothetical protein